MHKTSEFRLQNSSLRLVHWLIIYASSCPWSHKSLQHLCKSFMSKIRGVYFKFKDWCYSYPCECCSVCSIIAHSTVLTYWDRDKMDDTFQTKFSNAFSWMKNIHFDKNLTIAANSGMAQARHRAIIRTNDGKLTDVHMRHPRRAVICVATPTGLNWINNYLVINRCMKYCIRNVL